MGVLRCSVTVRDENGKVHRLSANTRVPKKLVHLIKNPNAWQQDEDEPRLAAPAQVVREDMIDQYSGKTIPELVEMARNEGVDLTGRTKKDEILNALRNQPREIEEEF